jgi:Ca2+-transporting ATPase
VIFDPTHSIQSIIETVESILRSGAGPHVDSGFATAPGPAWHTMSVEETAERIQTNVLTGLTEEESRERLQKYGKNVLPQPVPRSLLQIFTKQFQSFPVLLLMGTSVLSIVTGGIADAVVILGVVCLNAAIGTATESQSELSIAALMKVDEPKTVVMRGGSAIPIGAEDVVPGDVLMLSRGSYVPADARLLSTDRLTVDESALTGESSPAEKDTEPLSAGVLPLGDRSNMVYRGTVITGGSGSAIVVATASLTEFGHIHSLIATSGPPETPLQRQLRHLGNQLVQICGALSAAVFITGLLRGYGVMQMLKTGISLAVSAIPEGLPTVATTTLAYGVRQLRSRNVLVRHLEAVETLGAVGVLCLDKTGTLTMNEMTVVALHLGLARYEVRGGRVLADGLPIEPLIHPDLRRLTDVCILCSEAEIHDSGGKAGLQGTPTENALIRFALDCGFDPAEKRALWPLVRTEQRSQAQNYMTTLHVSPSRKRLLAVKGNPDEVLALCRWYQQGATVYELSRDVRATIQAENQRMSGAALRVLGFAIQEDSSEMTSFDSGLIWLGMAGIADPPRPGVKEVIQVLHNAGVRTIMVTGDQSGTAYAIARDLNLGEGGEMELIDSNSLEQLAPEVLASLVRRVHVFSRVNPAHKLRIVQALQRTGAIVAMTGDGINDGPALKTAEVGIAMGSGSEAAREVADVILVNDDIKSMVEALAVGRTRYDDIRKSIHFIMASNLSEVFVMFASVALGMGSPLNPRQLLWINLLTDVFPELALAVEPPEPDVLVTPPRKSSDQLFTRAETRHIGMEACLITASALAAYRIGLGRYGPGPQASSIAFLTLTSTQLLHTISSRSDRHSIFDTDRLPPNEYIPAALGSGFLVELMSLVIPSIRRILGSAPLRISDLLVVGGVAGTHLIVAEALKYMRVHSERAHRPAGPSPLPAGAFESATDE